MSGKSGKLLHVNAISLHISFFFCFKFLIFYYSYIEMYFKSYYCCRKIYRNGKIATETNINIRGEGVQYFKNYKELVRKSVFSPN